MLGIASDLDVTLAVVVALTGVASCGYGRCRHRRQHVCCRYRPLDITVATANAVTIAIPVAITVAIANAVAIAGVIAIPVAITVAIAVTNTVTSVRIVDVVSGKYTDACWSTSDC